MRKAFAGAVLLSMGLNGLSWAEPTHTPPSPRKGGSAATAPSSTLPTPLPAEMFRGQVREAYKAAAEIPEVLAQVKCYCGCDKSQGHRNLLDCFVDDHGAG